MSKITYDDKVTSNPQPSIPAVNKVTGDDMTEIKTVVNDNDTSTASHIGSTSNPHTVTKAQVGLSAADNTSDADKPVSTATQTALDKINYAKTGILFEDNFDGTTLAAEWIKTGGTLNTVVGGGVLNIQNPAGATFSTYIYRNDKTYNSNYFSYEMEYVIKQTSGADFGVSLALKHQSGRHYDFRFGHATAKAQLFYNDSGTGAVSGLQFGVAPLVGDKIKLKVIIRGLKASFQVFKDDILLNTLRVDWLADLNETYKQPNIITPAIGLFATPEIDVNYVKFTDLNKDKPKLCFIGDSYTQGFDAINTDDIWTNKVGDYFNIKSSKYSSGGSTSTNILNGLEQAIANLPENVILMIGVNDTILATSQSNITSIVDQLEAEGINVFVCTPELFNLSAPLNDWIRTTYSTQLIDMVGFLAGGNTGNTVVGDLDSSTGHPNVFANTLMSEGVIEYLIENNINI